MLQLEELVIRKLKTTRQIICTVESCTGGLLAHLLTNVPGASEVYWGSFVTYDHSAKEALGVSPELLKKQGAVSQETASALALYGLKKMEQQLQSTSFSHLFSLGESIEQRRGFRGVSLAFTGIAGPQGGSTEKPVGLCFLGLCQTGEMPVVKEVRVSPSLSRPDIKAAFVQEALLWLKNLL